MYFRRKPRNSQLLSSDNWETDLQRRHALTTIIATSRHSCVNLPIPHQISFLTVFPAFPMQSANLHPFDLPIQRILVDFETRLPPWMKLVPPSQAHEATSAFARLTQEITAFADLVSPTTKEKKVREMIIGRLQNEVRKIWSHAKVIPIGSYAQGLYTSSRSSRSRLFDISPVDSVNSLWH